MIELSNSSPGDEVALSKDHTIATLAEVLADFEVIVGLTGV